MIETDEKVRGETGQFPEDEESDEVAGEHQAEHRGHEKTEKEVKAPQVLTTGEVASGIDEDQSPDAGHQQCEDQAQAVKVEGEGHTGGRQPRETLQNGSARGDPACLTDIIDGQRQRQNRQKPAGPTRRQARDRRREQRQENSGKDGP